MEDLLKLIVENAQGVADPSGKTQLDSFIEAHALTETNEVLELLLIVLPQLDEHDWKQWRAFRQITGRLRVKSIALRNQLAILTEEGRPTDSRARFYAYLARSDLGEAPSLAELAEDNSLRSERPGDWLQLALNQTSPASFRAEALKLAEKLKATDFAFKLGPLREKYGEHFVESMTQLCLAMPFSESLELANFIDEEYNCGIHSEVLAHHSKLRGDITATRVVVPEIWLDLNDDFKTNILEKA